MKMAETKATPLLSAGEALQIVLKVIQRLPPVTLPLHDALGKVLAKDIRAADPLPPFPPSIKDGYAVVASDGPGEYPVVTKARAGGDGVSITVTPGTVAYITTRAPIPEGADAVVQVEDTEQVHSNESKRVRLLVQTTKGVDIRLVIRDSNRAMIMATSLQHHCEVRDFDIARDDEEGLEKIMNAVISVGIDILLTSGGVSVGDKDFVKLLLQKRGTVHLSKGASIPHCVNGTNLIVPIQGQVVKRIWL